MNSEDHCFDYYCVSRVEPRQDVSARGVYVESVTCGVWCSGCVQVQQVSGAVVYFTDQYDVRMLPDVVNRPTNRSKAFRACTR